MGGNRTPGHIATPMVDVLYRDANESDAVSLATLFTDTFTETFQHLYASSDLAAFLAQHSADHWAEQLRDPAFAVRVAEQNEQAVGLAKIGPVKLPVEDPGLSLELRQLYVIQHVRGSGVAAELRTGSSARLARAVLATSTCPCSRKT